MKIGLAALVLSFFFPVQAIGSGVDVLTEIHREALLPSNEPAGRPLPLVSHWNMGSQGRGWTPQYQLELLADGHHILPWLGWPRGNPDAADKTPDDSPITTVPFSLIAASTICPFPFGAHSGKRCWSNASTAKVRLSGALP